MSEPPATTEAVGRRTHPLTTLVQGFLWAVGAFVALVGSSFSSDNADLPGISLRIGLSAVAGLVIGLIAGYATWYFTRFVIDGTELRITSGVFTKNSRRIPYERIQSVDIAEPLVARLFGLAELRIDMAGGDSSRTSLRYLPIDDVRELRRVLLARAHGSAESGDDESPVDESRSLITVVPVQRIIVGTLLSLDFLGAVALLLATIAAALWFDAGLVILGGLIPSATYIAQIVGKRVLEQWNFALSRGERGLGIERGLLNRTSQTIPYDRVQGIAVKEPFIWRRLGWQRLEVDVAGYSAGAESTDNTDTSTLLPITDPALAEAVIAELVPLHSETITTDRPTTRSRLFAPIGWKYRWIEARHDVVVSQRGWIERSTNVVPHYKAQSVEISQGPLQRLRDVASVSVHTPPGPVDVDGSHLDAGTARRFWREQVDRVQRASAARGGVLGQRVHDLDQIAGIEPTVRDDDPLG